MRPELHPNEAPCVSTSLVGAVRTDWEPMPFLERRRRGIKKFKMPRLTLKVKPLASIRRFGCRLRPGESAFPNCWSFEEIPWCWVERMDLSQPILEKFAQVRHLDLRVHRPCCLLASTGSFSMSRDVLPIGRKRQRLPSPQCTGLREKGTRHIEPKCSLLRSAILVAAHEPTGR